VAVVVESKSRYPTKFISFFFFSLRCCERRTSDKREESRRRRGTLLLSSQILFTAMAKIGAKQISKKNRSARKLLQTGERVSVRE